MHELFQPSLPCWQFVVRGAIAYLGLLMLLRLTGKRSFGEMSPFDIVVLIMVGGALRSAMVGGDESLTGGFIVVATILVADKALGWLSARSALFNRILEGRSSVLAANGAQVPGALRRHDIAPAAFERELRIHKAPLEAVQEARLEANGKITVSIRER